MSLISDPGPPPGPPPLLSSLTSPTNLVLDADIVLCLLLYGATLNSLCLHCRLNTFIHTMEEDIDIASSSAASESSAWQCSWCSKSFSTKSNMNKHMNSDKACPKKLKTVVTVEGSRRGEVKVVPVVRLKPADSELALLLSSIPSPYARYRLAQRCEVAHRSCGPHLFNKPVSGKTSTGSYRSCAAVLHFTNLLGLVRTSLVKFG